MSTSLFLPSDQLTPKFLETLPIITHGSENSLDHDVYVLCPHPLQAKDAKPFNDYFTQKGMNANPICVENNKVVWNLKGTNDEVHNSIYYTYELHQQSIEKPILSPTERIHGLKALRTIRGLLSTCSRTQYRDIIKPALSQTNLSKKIEVLQSIDFTQINDFGKSSIVETGKFFAFQIGQTLSLLSDNEDLFTKNGVAKKYPSLAQLIERNPNTDLSPLIQLYNQQIEIYQNQLESKDGIAYYNNQFNNCIEKIEIIKEKVLDVSPNTSLSSRLKP